MKITIGIPMYAGAGGYTVRALLSLQAALLERSDVAHFDIEMGGSIIPKVRNRIVRRFLAGTDDYLVFIDADMVFDAADVLRLVDSGVDMCGLNYLARKKETQWMNKLERDEDGEIQAFRERGGIWVKTACAGTGILAIHRRALERMAASYKHLIYDDAGPTLALFDFALIDGKYWGEDYLFCKRWQDIGGELWTLADATVGHMGETAYTGNFCDALGGVKT